MKPKTKPFTLWCPICKTERVVESDFVRAPAVAVPSGRILPSVPCKLHNSTEVMFQWLSERGKTVLLWKDSLCPKM